MKEKYLNTGRKKQKQKTRNQILASAQRFFNNGQSFTLEDVAKDAGLSRATVYRYYSNVEVLSVEAGLDLNVDPPEVVVERLKDLPIEEIILGIQDYYNRFTIDNETAFRKFLSVVIPTDAPEKKRGARRSRAMRLALHEAKTNLKLSEIDKLTHIATVLMGIEAIIVTKDVCRLSDESSLESLRWGLEMILKGLFTKSKS